MKKENLMPMKTEKNDIMVRPSKPLIKLFKKVEALQTLVPDPYPSENDKKAQEISKDYYFSPLGIMKNGNVISVENMGNYTDSLTPYQHMIVQKGDFSVNYITTLFSLYKEGSISEYSLKELIRTQVHLNGSCYRGAIASIVVDLVAAYFSHFLEIIKKEYPEYYNSIANELFESKVILTNSTPYARIKNSTLFEEVYSTVYSYINLNNTAFDNSELSTIAMNHSLYSVELPAILSLLIYDNIHIKLCNKLGEMTYETISKIMNDIVNEMLTSLHDAIAAVVRELLEQLYPVYIDHASLREYAYSRDNSRRNDEYDDEYDDIFGDY